ncbi:MAG: hypothetical protein ABIK10_01040 [candidate division WOR-3 bacterium]
MKIVIGVIGASGIIAQFLLLRELLVNFNGNEFSIGITLGLWLLAEALGAYCARYIKFSYARYRFLIFLFGVILLLALVITKIIRPITGILPGEIFTLTQMLTLSLLIIGPVSFFHGMLFTASSEVLLTQISERQKIPGLVYSLENLGTIIGGFLFSFLLLPKLSTTMISLLISLLHSLAIMLVGDGKTGSKFYWALAGVILYSSLMVYSPRLDKWVLAKNFPSYEVLGTVNTHYSNITIVRRENQQTFYIDGMPVITSPDCPKIFVEEFVNFPLLVHDEPQRVLVVGNGLGGIISQLAISSINEITYVESDPDLVSVVASYSTSEIINELNSFKVKIKKRDPRLFLMGDTNKYDLIFINIVPLNLQTNRFFTEEFFRLCKKRLNNTGILVTTTPGSLTYLSPVLQKLILSHFNTLKTVFPSVAIILGDFNIYLSRYDTWQDIWNVDSLYFRLAERKIFSQVFNRNYLAQRISYIYTESIEDKLQRNLTKETRINSDFVPWGLFYNLNYYNLILNPKLQAIFKNLENLDFLKIFVVMVLLFAGIVGLMRYFNYKKDLTMFLAIFTTGFSAMLSTLILSFIFQIYHGYLYYQISVLITTFIIGSVAGAYSSDFIKSIKIKTILINEGLIIFFLFVILMLTNFPARKIYYSQAIFFFLLFTEGFLIGFEFPLAINFETNYLPHRSENIKKNLSKLYAADLLGGFLGALLGATVFLPTLGIIKTITLLVSLKILSGLLVLTKK